MQSFNKLLDLDLSIIQDAYEAEYLKQEKQAEHERGEVKFRMLVEAAAYMVMILREDETIAYCSPYSQELTGHSRDRRCGKIVLAVIRSGIRSIGRIRGARFNHGWPTG